MLAVRLDAIGIIRVSRRKGREGDRWASPPIQRQRIEEACQREGLNLIRIEEELDVSGGKPLDKRPGLKRALESIEAGEAQVLVAAYFDRLYRSVKVVIEVAERAEAANAKVLALDSGWLSQETASSWQDLMQKAITAEGYRRQIKERAGAAQDRAIERGVPIIAYVPPGYYRGEDGRLLVDSVRAPIMAQAFKMRAEGSTIHEARTYLKAHGIKYSYSGLAALFRNPLYVGRIEFGGKVKDNAHPAVVDMATWQAVQKRKDSRGRYTKSERLLARLGILRCATCGHPLTAGCRTSKSDPSSYPVYRCSEFDCPQKVTIGAEKVENFIEHFAKLQAHELVGTASNDQHVVEGERELASIRQEGERPSGFG